MSTWMPWVVARKDFKLIRRKKSVFGYTIALPIVLATSFSFVVKADVVGASPPDASLGLAFLTWFFVLLAAVLPASIAAYSIVGEKVEKSLEPLLATPPTDSELLLGKAIAAFLPAILSIWVGSLIFMSATDYLTYGVFSGYYFPSSIPVILLFLAAPLAALLGVQVAVILSSRVTDVRGANQLAGLVWIPFMTTLIAGAEGVFQFDSATTFLAISAVLLLADVVLFFVSKATFSREEILTKWR